MDTFGGKLSRRQFLGSAAGFLGGLWAPDWLAGAAWAAGGGYPIAIDGEDFGIAHKVRDGAEFTIPAPSRTVDVVIVGGGISGLTAAYQLRQHDVLILEKERKPGGHARRGQWRGIYYSEGTSYFSAPDEELEAFYQAVGVPMKPIPEPTDRFLVGGRDMTNIWAGGSRHLPYADKVRRAFARFKHDIENMSPMPMLPVEKTDPATLKLDKLSFAAWARPYGPELGALLDIYCRSAMGGGANEVSAYWGINFYSSEFTPALTLPGGTAGMAEILAAKLQAAGPGRVEPGATVIRVEPAGDGKVHVTYVRNGETVTVAARAAILAVSKHYAKRIVTGLPADQLAAMGRMRYQPYLVVNLLVHSAPYKASYDTWVSGAPFTDFIIADWISGLGHKGRSVLTVMAPIPVPERYSLLQDDMVRARVRAIVARMEQLVPGMRGRIDGARAYRWGHPLLLPAVGALTGTQPISTRPFGPVLFAHSDSQGSPCIESAIWEGKKTAAQALKLIARGRGQMALA